jgi:hypothetical protein
MNHWPDGTPKSSHNGFTLWKTEGHSVMYVEKNNARFSEGARKARESGKINEITYGSQLKPKDFHVYSKVSK